jgi:hypothetical protein
MYRGFLCRVISWGKDPNGAQRRCRNFPSSLPPSANGGFAPDIGRRDRLRKILKAELPAIMQEVMVAPLPDLVIRSD